MSDYIYHHGIKGQKWGVRRYQNPDGTLTSMGKARKRAIDVNRNMDAVNDIVKTMSRKDKELLNLDGDVYQQSAEDGYAYVPMSKSRKSWRWARLQTMLQRRLKLSVS